MIKPIRDGIFFIFLDKTHDAGFIEQTNWGFRYDYSQNKQSLGFRSALDISRWGKVIALGDEVNRKEIPMGSYICIEKLMWTNAFDYVDNDGDSFNIWKTDPTKILLVSSTKP